jgi:dolichol-phosphate mannosyltransferase
MSLKTSIILCVYNEEKYIENTILELEKKISNLEIIIVDDFSSDGTIDILKKINQEGKHKVIFRKKSRSLGSAFVRGVIETTGDYIGWVDANMSEVINKFPKMIQELETDNDIILLSRYVDGGDDKRILLRSLSSRIFNRFCKIVFRTPVTDYTGSIFLRKRKVLDEVTFLGYGYGGEFFLEFIYNAYNKNFKIKEIPYIQNKDEDIMNSKGAPNLIKFFYFGIMYFFRIFITLMRKKN